MKIKNQILAMVEIAIVLCAVFLVAMPAIAADYTTQKVSATEVTTASEDDYVLGIYGNANEDDTIDMRDLTYVKLIFFGKKPETELADAKYDGKINPLDFIQIKLIIVGREKELTFVDVVGEAVTVQKPVKRIVLTMSDSAEVLRAFNAEDKIVGVSKYIKDNRLFFPELSKLPCVGNFFKPDYEAILNLNPDVFLTYLQPGMAEKKKEYMEKLPGVTIISLDQNRLYTLTENVKKLGYILDDEDEADEFINWYEGCRNKIKELTEGLSEDEKPRVFHWSFFKPGGGYQSISKGHRAHQVCIIAGGKNIAEDLGGGLHPKVDPEWVMIQNPDIIVVYETSLLRMGYTVDDPSEVIAIREQILNRLELANVAAVKNGRVYMMAAVGTFGYPSGGGCLIGTAYMAKWFHPDLFEDLDPEAIHQEYLTRFQGLDYDLDEHGVFAYPPIEINGGLAGIPDNTKGRYKKQE